MQLFQFQQVSVYYSFFFLFMHLQHIKNTIELDL